MLFRLGKRGGSLHIMSMCFLFTLTNFVLSTNNYLRLTLTKTARHAMELDLRVV